MTDNTMREKFARLKAHERHANAAESRYWCTQYKLFAEQILEQAAQSYPKDKPEECVNGCPKNQVCDYCQSTAAAMIPCGTSVTNVYEAYEAGKKAAQSVLLLQLERRCHERPPRLPQQEAFPNRIRSAERS